MATNAIAPENLKKGFEVTQATKNLSIEGLSFLRAEKVTTTYKVEYELNPITKAVIRPVSKEMVKEDIEVLKFPLKEVKAEKLAAYRKNGIPSFVIKINERLFHAEIPATLSLLANNSLGAHMCSSGKHLCKRLSAASDEDGGCSKVRGFSNRIERYPYIAVGYETFNTKHDTFTVLKCLHYEKCPPRAPLTIAERNQAKLNLAKFVWEDVETLAEVRRRKDKNKNRYETY